MLSRGLWTAFHVKIIKYQNNRLVDAVILVEHCFRWNRPHLWANLQKVRGALKVGVKCKNRLNSNRNLGNMGETNLGQAAAHGFVNSQANYFPIKTIRAHLPNWLTWGELLYKYTQKLKKKNRVKFGKINIQ